MDLLVTCTAWGGAGPFDAGMEFSELGMVKNEAEHPMAGLNWLVTVLEERRATSFDVRASQEEPVEEINLADYFQSMIIDPSLEVRVAKPTVPLTDHFESTIIGGSSNTHC